MISSRAVRYLGLALLGLLLVVPLEGQSLTSIRGLGYPLTPNDARSEVLGGLGIGLQGLSTPLTNPAAVAGLTRRGAVVSVAAVEQTVALGGASDGMGATRFPLIGIMYPVRGIVLTAGYGGYLDQSWAVERAGQQDIGGSTVAFQDFARSAGGIGQLQVGAAAPIGRRLAVGAAIGAYTGQQRLHFQRLFETTSFGRPETFNKTRNADYFAPLAQVGVRWDPAAVLRLAASVTWAGTLESEYTWGDQLGASDEDPREATTTEYSLPMKVAAGASAYLAPSLLATISGRWSGWSAVGLVPGTGFDTGNFSSSRDTWEVGGGLEFNNPSPRETRTFPIRIGGQYRQLPFSFGDEAPTEWFVGAGLGMRIGPTAVNPVVRADLSVQRGERTAVGASADNDLTESAWRVSLSLSVFGN